MKEIRDTRAFYSAVARTYDRGAGYAEPVDKELKETRRKIKLRHRRYMKGHTVLEIACGTGYWTEVIARMARSVLAIDASKKMISIARGKLKKYKNVKCKVSDAYSLKNIRGRFSAAYGHWWWSHMPKSKIRHFLVNLHKKLLPGAFVFFGDHRPNYSDKKTRVIFNQDGDRIEVRKLVNRKIYYVIKNFPTEGEIYRYLYGIARDIKLKKYGGYYRGYWELCYKVVK